MPASSHTPGWHCSVPRGNFPVQKSSLAGKGRMRWGTNFSSFSYHYMKDPLQFHTTQRLTKLRQIKTGWSKEECLGLPISATQQEQLWFTALCRIPTAFATEETKAQDSCHEPPADFTTVISPHRFPPSRMPPDWLPPCPQLDPPICTGNQLGLCSCMSARCQPRPLQLIHCRACIWG